jgi:hypothetical protein
MAEIQSRGESFTSCRECDSKNFRYFKNRNLWIGIGLAVLVVFCLSSTYTKSSVKLLSGLWESDDSPSHDPYFNVFDDGIDESAHDNHRHWSSEDVREKVWQTLKDVEAMEDHVVEQNALNYKLKKQITTLDDGITREQDIIQLLVKEGMSHVDNRLKFMQDAIASNVSAVRSTLRILKAEDAARQRLQDQEIGRLDSRHKALASSTAAKLQKARAALISKRHQPVATFMSSAALHDLRFGCAPCSPASLEPQAARHLLARAPSRTQVDRQVSDARTLLESTKAQLVRDREAVRALINKKIEVAAAPCSPPPVHAISPSANRDPEIVA